MVLLSASTSFAALSAVVKASFSFLQVVKLSSTCLSLFLKRSFSSWRSRYLTVQVLKLRSLLATLYLPLA